MASSLCSIHLTSVVVVVRRVIVAGDSRHFTGWMSMMAGIWLRRLFPVVAHRPLAIRNLVTVSISITTLDNELSHRLEPRAAAPHRRLRTVEALSGAGIPVRVSVSPVILALNEHELDAIIEAAAEAGATGANAIVLRLPHELAQLFPEWLEAHYPLKKDRVLKAIRSLRNGKLNDSDFKSRFSGQGPRADILRQHFESALWCNR